MPAFFPEGKSTYDKLWKGDAVKQIEAMWTYLKEADRSRPPEGMEPSEKFILRPADRPIVHRTFMKDVGTHAIAVGFPGGINYAFDAKDCRLAMIWKGDFISAESAWADRFTPFVEPLGDAIVAMPTGPALARMAEPCDAWPDAAGDAVFSQYALSGSGFPILSYVVDELNVIEQLGVSKAGDVLERRVHCDGDVAECGDTARAITGNLSRRRLVCNGGRDANSNRGVALFVAGGASGIDAGPCSG